MPNKHAYNSELCIYKDISKESLIDEYIVKRQTAFQVSQILGHSKSKIDKALKYHNVKKSSRYPDEFTQEIKDFLYGTLLGDAGLRLTNNNPLTNNARLKVLQGVSQADYLFHKYGLMHLWTNQGPKYRRYFDERTGKYYSSYNFHTANLPIFKQLYDIFYQNGKKVVTEEILQCLNDRSLAYWFMDDGHKVHFRAYGSTTPADLKISTDNFTFKEDELMQAWFKKRWNLKCNISKKRPNQYLLVFTGNSMRKLADIVRPYIIPSMEYKIAGL